MTVDGVYLCLLFEDIFCVHTREARDHRIHKQHQETGQRDVDITCITAPTVCYTSVTTNKT